MSDLSISTSFVESASIDELREMGLLRQDIEPLMEPQSPLTYGVASYHGRNVSNVIFETRSALQQRCRDFARRQGFSLRVASNSWRKAANEGNAKYVCKRLNGQQPLVVGNVEQCPFYIAVYELRDQWKITQMNLAHNHHLHAGFQEDTFVEGGLADDTTR
ncbi:hypothetical protein PC129_g22210 [Phytophthora cactorum]|uniref:FAR1 domain-containing protein n=1 Tax=Phytophthora cactorum TaxID=29920 RepID=A0A329RK52_9STRA|nr:hypothetical protein Pcac1_g5116 [Phytophthora cactorum]KAG2806053.1 hypothetical protein PC112_g18005 [Phytophthora cactorum]KAG2807679.1 hypothetical protein PC111_g16826 [Phytophthora cactorum]KAG2827426.1 hypothetical protein PC113_g21626 [Phytophthora cactorum]KAG2876597.1 hypothetical protein PC114_g24123 [Phytophthora cactorum]